MVHCVINALCEWYMHTRTSVLCLLCMWYKVHGYVACGTTAGKFCGVCAVHVIFMCCVCSVHGCNSRVLCILCMCCDVHMYCACTVPVCGVVFVSHVFVVRVCVFFVCCMYVMNVCGVSDTCVRVQACCVCYACSVMFMSV